MSKIDLPISKPIITRQVSDITIFIRLKYPNWNTVSKILTLVPETFLEGFKDRLFFMVLFVSLVEIRYYFSVWVNKKNWRALIKGSVRKHSGTPREEHRTSFLTKYNCKNVPRRQIKPKRQCERTIISPSAAPKIVSAQLETKSLMESKRELFI